MPFWFGLGLIWLGWWCVALLVPIRIRVRAAGGTATFSGWVEADVAWLLLRRQWRVTVDSAGLKGLGRQPWRLRWARTPLGRLRSGRLRALMAAGVPALVYLQGRLWVRRLRLALAVGTGDSLSTAMACGAVWSLVGTLLAGVSAAGPLQPDAAVVEVCPSFGPAGLAGRLDCTAGIRPLHVVLAGGILVRRGGLRIWRQWAGARSAAHGDR